MAYRNGNEARKTYRDNTQRIFKWVAIIKEVYIFLLCTEFVLRLYSIPALLPGSFGLRLNN